MRDQWLLRDLASRNGTRVNQRVVEQGESVSLGKGDAIVFGEQEEWVLDDLESPGASARAADGARVYGEGDSLALPRDDEPEICVQLVDEGWVLESADECRRVVHGERLLAGGVEWTLELPPITRDDLSPPIGSTKNADVFAEMSLKFTVGAAEEHVALMVFYRGKSFDLGARAHNYPLLLLARERLKDAKEGRTELESGWLYREDLVSMLGSDRKLMNLLLWRARKCFGEAGLPVEQLIERRLDAEQLRLAISADAIAEIA